MELKATLKKPYTKNQRLDFIVEQNHNKGYEIKETESALEAWGLTAEEQAEKEKAKRRAELIDELNALDLKAVRSMRALAAGTGTNEDKEFLETLEQQAEEKRAELKKLGEK